MDMTDSNTTAYTTVA